MVCGEIPVLRNNVLFYDLISDFTVQQLILLHPVIDINDIIPVLVSADDNLADAGIDNLPLAHGARSVRSALSAKILKPWLSGLTHGMLLLMIL